MKSALARAGSVSKLRGPRSLSISEGSPQKQTPKTVTFDKTDEVIQYDVMTPELTEEYWDQVSLQSCDSDIGDREGHDARPLPPPPQFMIPTTLRRKDPVSPLQNRRTLMGSPLPDEDFDFNLNQKESDKVDLSDVKLPEPLESPEISPEPPVLDAPSMSTRIDAMLASGSGMSPSLRGSGHRRTDSQMSELSEASAPYLPLRSPQKYKPEDDEEDPAKWRDTSAAAVARQDSLQDNQRHPPTVKVSDSALPAPVELERTYSKRRKDLAHMLDPRTTSTAHSVGTIMEEAEEPDTNSRPVSERWETASETDTNSRPVSERWETASEQTDIEENIGYKERLPQHASPPHQHEITPLLSEDSHFIASQHSMPQSSSEVLQNDFDFGNDSFWKGGFLRQVRDATEEGDETATANDTANATIGIAGEPAAQYAAGISPQLPDYTDGDDYEVEENYMHAEKADAEPNDLGLDQAEDYGHSDIHREHSYLNIKNLASEDMSLDPTLSPISSENEFPHTLDPMADDNDDEGEFDSQPVPTEKDLGSTVGQSTPQKADSLQQPSAETQAENAESANIDQQYQIPPVAVSEDTPPTPAAEASTTSGASTSPEIVGPVHRDLPETPAKSQPQVPRVRVLPWDPSIENFQTSPIPVPDRSPQRQSPVKRNTTTVQVDDTSGQSLKPEQDVPPTIDDVIDNSDKESIDAELRDLLDSASLHSSSFESRRSSISLGEINEVSAGSSETVKDGSNIIPEPQANGSDSLENDADLSQHHEKELSDPKANHEPVTENEEINKPSSVPTLSPVTFSPFVPPMTSPIVSSMKEPSEVRAAGIDELVASPVGDEAQMASILSPMSLSNHESPDVRAKNQHSDDSDISMRGEQPPLDSDLSDFEASPHEAHDETSEATLRRPAFDEQSVWESVTSVSPSVSSQQPSASPVLQTGRQTDSQESRSWSRETDPAYVQSSVSEDISLREPSFGESMSSTLQHMLSQRSDLGADSIDRSYTVKEYGSYVIAKSPNRRPRRSQALEVLREDNGSAYSTQIAIPRNRPLPSHSSPEHKKPSDSVLGASQDNVRAPSVISRTDSSSYSLGTNSLNSSYRPLSTMRGGSYSRMNGETKLGAILEPQDDFTEKSSTQTTSAVNHRDQPFLGTISEPIRELIPEPTLGPIPEPTLGPIPEPVPEPLPEPTQDNSLSEESVIAASSSKTGRDIRLLDKGQAQSFDRQVSNGKPMPVPAAAVSSASDYRGSKQYQPTIFPNGVLFLVVKGISLTCHPPQDTMVALTLDNGVHCVTSAPRKLSEIGDFAEEYRIGILEAPLSVTLRLLSSHGPVEAPELELGADGSLAKIPVSNLSKEAFGNRRELTLRGVNEWASWRQVSCTVDVSAMYIPCVSHRERLPNRLSDAVGKIDEARGLLREKQARMQGVLRQYGGDIIRHHGKQRWFVLDPVAPLLVAHSLRSHKARTLINLSKATSTAQVDTHKLEIRFRNEDCLIFQVQSTLELAAWLRALRGCIGNQQTPRPKWIDAVIYETENGAISNGN